MWHYYTEVEDALKISGPVDYPWGPKRPRYPYRQHQINAAGQVLARGCEAIGISWAMTPIATLSAPRGDAHPCVYRGFCKFGCSTNAKQSALVTWIPRAIARRRRNPRFGNGRAGRDRSADGRATGVHYHPRGQVAAPAREERRRRRLCDRNAAAAAQLGVRKNSRMGWPTVRGLVGKYLMPQSNHAVFGTFEEEIRWYKAPPSLAMTEHWNYSTTARISPAAMRS